MAEPTTAAGKRLRDDLAFAAPELWDMHIDRRIKEAQAEARAQERERLRARWEALANASAAPTESSRRVIDWLLADPKPEP